METTTLRNLAGPVDVSINGGVFSGVLEIREVKGGQHAYLLDATTGAKLVYLPFDPDAARSVAQRGIGLPGPDPDAWYQLGVRVDHSSGDARRVSWHVRTAVRTAVSR